MRASEVYVSALSTWEIRTKHRLGRWAEANGLVTGLPGHISRVGFTPLPIEIDDDDRESMTAAGPDIQPTTTPPLATSLPRYQAPRSA